MKIGFYGLGPASFPYVNYSLVQLNDFKLAAVFPPVSLLGLFSIARSIEKRNNPLVVFGYSRGAIAALRLCRILLQRQIKIRFLYLIDPISYYGQLLRIPSNVEQGFACFQRNGARTPILFGRFGKGIAKYVFTNTHQANRFITEQVNLLKNSRPALHEDMVYYSFFEATIPLLSVLREIV
ncbi:alpha/beta hydrolase [Candidatus Methylacidiphilum infernorum]|uniref:Alpha/beta hydrolase superfamily protein n=1 Tax=Methylacidiphilum infernorum (isolate V4) TaxID=481448 RepID=B3DUT0_METI4|nr:alpha/beta hydrolase [Candidatus Methylacidiphilum infernorum]ACD83083.1 alpha/beta hydrolase superfamily protein [Methylacidiphilum infernorum V4]